MADSIKLPKPKYGQIVVLQKNGDEPRGHGFPLTGTCCVIGRQESADIRVSSADVSLVHCKVVVDDETGEAALEVHGEGTEVNGALVDPVAVIKLNHRDVVVVGGRKLRFEYLPPDYKPIPGKSSNGITHKATNQVGDQEHEGEEEEEEEEEEEAVKAEVVDTEECQESEEAAAVEAEAAVPSTPANSKRVSFGPYLSPEQFDNSLPPATPVKRGATPRRVTRYSGLRFSRASIDPVPEEESTCPTPEKSKEEQPIKEVALVNETVVDEEEEGTTNAVDSSSIDAMSTVSDVSNQAVIPSECCSFLDEDFSSVITGEGDESCASGQISEIPSPIPETDAEGLQQLLEETTDPQDLLTETQEVELLQSPVREEENAAEEKLALPPPAAPTSPQADYTDVRGVKKLLQTPKAPPQTPKADYTNVAGVKRLLQTPKPLPESPKADYTDVAGMKKLLQTPKPAATSPKPDYTDVTGMKKLLETPKPAPESPKADYTNVTGVKKLLQTPKATVVATASPVADYSDVAGIKKLMQTPKPAPETPKADYLNVTGVKRLLRTPAATPKADYSNVEGVQRLLETPKAAEMKTDSGEQDERPLSPDSGCQTPPEEVAEALDTGLAHDEDSKDTVVLDQQQPSGEEKPELDVPVESEKCPEEPTVAAVEETETTVVSESKGTEATKEVVVPAVAATPNRRGGRGKLSCPTPATQTESPKKEEKAPATTPGRGPKMAEATPQSKAPEEPEAEAVADVVGGEKEKLEEAPPAATPLRRGGRGKAASAASTPVPKAEGSAVQTPARRGSRNGKPDTPAPSKNDPAGSNDAAEIDVTPPRRGSRTVKPDTPVPSKAKDEGEVQQAPASTPARRGGRKTADKIHSIPESIPEELEQATNEAEGDNPAKPVSDGKVEGQEMKSGEEPETKTIEVPATTPGRRSGRKAATPAPSKPEEVNSEAVASTPARRGGRKKTGTIQPVPETVTEAKQEEIVTDAEKPAEMVAETETVLGTKTEAKVEETAKALSATPERRGGCKTDETVAVAAAPVAEEDQQADASDAAKSTGVVESGEEASQETKVDSPSVSPPRRGGKKGVTPASKKLASPQTDKNDSSAESDVNGVDEASTPTRRGGRKTASTTPVKPDEKDAADAVVEEKKDEDQSSEPEKAEASASTADAEKEVVEEQREATEASTVASEEASNTDEPQKEEVATTDVGAEAQTVQETPAPAKEVEDTASTTESAKPAPKPQSRRGAKRTAATPTANADGMAEPKEGVPVEDTKTAPATPVRRGGAKKAAARTEEVLPPADPPAKEEVEEKSQPAKAKATRRGRSALAASTPEPELEEPGKDDAAEKAPPARRGRKAAANAKAQDAGTVEEPEGASKSAAGRGRGRKAANAAAATVSTPEPTEEVPSAGSPPSRRATRVKAAPAEETDPKPETPSKQPARASKRGKARTSNDSTEGKETDSQAAKKSKADENKEEMETAAAAGGSPIPEGMAMPVVRLTRLRVPTGKSSIEPAVAASPAKAARTKKVAEEEKEEEVVAAAASPAKATRSKKVTEEKPVPARRGRTTKAAQHAEQNGEDAEEKKPAGRATRKGASATVKPRADESGEEDAEEEAKPASRPARGSRSKKAAPEPEPAADSSADEGDEREPKTASKTTTARGKKPAKRSAPQPKAESSGEEEEEEQPELASGRGSKSKRAAPEEKRRKVTKKAAQVAPLDDVEMLHEGKGHAADIHAAAIESNAEDEEEEQPQKTSGRASKKVVHFDVESTPSSPARATRSGRKPASTVASKTVSVRLQREPVLDRMAAGEAAEPEETESKPTTAKRPRAGTKKAAAAAEVPETESTSPPRRTTRRTRI